MKTITYEEVLAAAETFRTEDTNPTDANESCFYAHGDGTPACIAGTIISVVAPELLKRIIPNDWNYDVPMSKLAEKAAAYGIAVFDAKARAFLMAAQAYADQAKRWSYAIERGEAAAAATR